MSGSMSLARKRHETERWNEWRAREIVSLLTERSLSIEAEHDFGSSARPVHPEILQRITAAVTVHRPLCLVLPAFPAKSANRQKTISHLPDLGEVMALRYLDDLCRRISTLHAPGARLVICSDGRVFSDLVGVTEEHVDAYRLALANIIYHEKFTHLSTYHLDDHFGALTFDGMRAALIKSFAESLVTIQRQVIQEEDRRLLFNGIHRFVFEDALAVTPDASRNRVRQAAKGIAYQVVQRSDAWSRLLAEKFPDAVRLSIHPHLPSTAKIGIKLVPGGGAWATPWHNCLIKEQGSYRLGKRAEALAKGAILQVHAGKYHYYAL